MSRCLFLLCLSNICFNYAMQSSCRTGTSEPPVLVALLARYAFLGHRRSAKDLTSNIWRYFAFFQSRDMQGGSASVVPADCDLVVPADSVSVVPAMRCLKYFNVLSLNLEHPFVLSILKSVLLLMTCMLSSPPHPTPPTPPHPTLVGITEPKF